MTTPTPVVTAADALDALAAINQLPDVVTFERCQKIRSALLRLQQLEQKISVEALAAIIHQVGGNLRQLERKASVEALAAIIRHVDGNNRLGAAALAEAILAHPGSRRQAADADVPQDRDSSIEAAWGDTTPAQAMEGLRRIAQ